MEGARVQEILSGLLAQNPSISPKYFYDGLGSRLFEIITLLDEYYPTRTEGAIMSQYSAEIAKAIGKCDVLLDLGAGNCQKGSALFDSLMPVEYRALDISKEFLEEAIAGLQSKFPHILMTAQEFDLQNPLSFPELATRKKTFFYPGSSIGNFDPKAASNLFHNLAKVCDGAGGLLIGVDLIKPLDILNKAYNDSLGITAAFNKNVLLNINRILSSNFQLDCWEHYAIFNEELGCIQMYLRATKDQRVTWQGGERLFKASELIHTENSYKYTQQHFESLLISAGFKSTQSWTDPRNQFLVTYASFA
ncbi:MAG: L-histidine N(alpha)-methyltransferase [Polynucleobacter sp. 24-46-87]|uniref:L-histidine N(alpha)-methyltransferase n=1 Tax=Polynucleobacter sp. 39-46-10 TaxID=1970428 RepID=UPI000BC566F3|nr:L-histidine N(alpha)-methyltransferase [Polynucleobacter sp. 39-46-10]OZA14718.1 MAG: L-histidine N(alpha)-methyltransferase [Polynucleobacter sp. 24-46-87]OZA78352.1 MAG: L-histidine N(alpha)-methyltransferase [Polynucleobacter sp. 39-46-10]